MKGYEIKNNKKRFLLTRLIILIIISCFVISFIYIFTQNDTKIFRNLSKSKKKKLKKIQNKNLNLKKFHLKKKFVFIGDQYIYNWQVRQPEFFYNQTLINKGISGDTVQNMFNRFEKDVINLNPYCVIILGGLNDLIGLKGKQQLKPLQVFEYLKKMVEISRKHKIKVYLCSIVPVYKIPIAVNKHQNFVKKIRITNNLLKKYAKKHKITYIDFFYNMSDFKGKLNRYYSQNGSCLNYEGFEMFKVIFFHYVKEIDKKPNKIFEEMQESISYPFVFRKPPVKRDKYADIT